MTRRKADGEKRVAGTYRRDRAASHPPDQGLGGPVAMPRGVLSASARRAWRVWAPELQALGLLTRLDGPMFALTCTWMGVALDAARELREKGIVCDDSRGREAKNRALTVLRAASVELRQLSAVFGLTPGDRAKWHWADEEIESIADILIREAKATEDG